MTTKTIDQTSRHLLRSTDSRASPSAAPASGPSPRCGASSVLSRSAAERRWGSDAVAEALSSGTCVELWPGVLAPAAGAGDPLTRAAGVLMRAGPGSVLSGPTAVALHGCAPVAPTEWHVTVPYDRQIRSGHGIAVHQAWIRESEVVELDGLRVRALEVALMECLCTGPQRWTLAAVERALDRAGPHRAAQLRAVVSERIAQRRDRRGTRRATALLAMAWAPASPGRGDAA